jgi:hypothetical protein
MMKSERTMPQPPCLVLGQGTVNLSPTAYKYKGTSDTGEGRREKGNQGEFF